MIPKTVDLDVELGNGKIKFEDLRQNVRAQVGNGKIKFKKSLETAYNFDARVTIGAIKGITSKDHDKSGHKVDLRITNGKISVE